MDIIAIFMVKFGGVCNLLTFSSRYVFGKSVKGKMSINMNLHGLGYYSNYLGQNNYMFMDVSKRI